MSSLPLDAIRKGTAILIGASKFPKDPEQLPPLPGVEGNLPAFDEVLQDSKYIGMEPKKIHRLLNAEPVHELKVQVSGLVKDEKELLFVYYAGHGFVDEKGALLLTTFNSTSVNRKATSYPWEELQADVIASDAKTKIVILDCCFSGRANAMSGNEDAVLAQLDTAGTVVITSSPRNGTASAGDSLRTTFTKALIGTIESGTPNAGASLDVEEVFTETKAQLRRISAPIPEIIRTADAAKTPFCNNVADINVQESDPQPPSATAAEQRGMEMDSIEALRACIAEVGEPRGPREWRSENDPERFAQNLEMILSATDDSVDPSPVEINLVYATMLLVEARLDATFSNTQTIAEMWESGDWPRAFVAVQAGTERLIERCLDVHKSREIRSALDEWIRGYALSVSNSGWDGEEVTETASRLAQALAKDEQDRQDLQPRLRAAAEYLQQGNYPSKALAARSGFNSVSSGRLETVRWSLIFELGAILREMTFDIYRHGRELVEQLGIVPEFTLEKLQWDLKTVQWAQDRKRNLCLRATCFDPAVEEAMNFYAEKFGDLREALPGTPSANSLIQFILDRANTDLVGPREKDGQLAYSPPIAHMTLNSDKIRQLLMGEQLYGDPHLAMRELYQNALDACRYRSYRHKYLYRKKGFKEAWTPVVRFEAHSEDGRAIKYLECIDNGVGMQPEVLERCFLNAGSRFVETAAFADEQASWLTVSDSLRLVPNSAFGIGAFSYFMLADAVEIMTIPQDASGNRGEGLRLLINAGSSIARLNTDESISNELPNGGTIVRLYLRPEFRTIGELQLRSFMDKVVLHSPYRLEVVEGNEEVSREPGETSPEAPSSKSVAWVDTDGASSAWWTEEDAPVLADGLITSTKFTGAMVTLHGEHKPLLRVDRTDIVNWDTDWVLDRISGAAETLANWDGLSLRWLWNFAEAYPHHGAVLAKQLQRIRPVLPLGQTNLWLQDVDINEVGIFPCDRYLVDQLQDSRFRERYPAPRMPEMRWSRVPSGESDRVVFPSCLIPWRRRTWMQHVPELFENWSGDDSEIADFSGMIMHDDRFPVWESETPGTVEQPDPIDAALIASRLEWSDKGWNPLSSSTPYSNYVDLVALVNGAARTRISLGEAVERVSRFARFSLLGVPSISADSIDYVPDSQDCLLISVPGARWELERDISLEDCLGLIPVCHQLGMSLGEAYQSFTKVLNRLGISSFESLAVFGDDGAHLPSAREARFMVEFESQRRSFGAGSASSHVAARQVARDLGMTQREIAQTASTYSAFGLGDMRDEIMLGDPVVSDRLLRKAWSANFDERAPWIDEDTFRRRSSDSRASTPIELLYHSLFFAVMEGIELSEAARMIAAFPFLTAEQKNLPLASIPSIVPTELDVRLLTRRVGRVPSISPISFEEVAQDDLIRWRLSPLEIKLAMEQENVSIEFLIERLRNFEYLDVAPPLCDLPLLGDFRFTDLEQGLLRSSDQMIVIWHGTTEYRDTGPAAVPIPVKHIFEVAESNRVPIGELYESRFRMDSIGVSFAAENPSGELAAFVPGRADCEFISKLENNSLGATICRTAFQRRCSIADVADQISPWIAWAVGKSSSVWSEHVDVLRQVCGTRMPTFSDVSFYNAVVGQTMLTRQSFNRFGALVLAAQAGAPVGFIVEKFIEFSPLFELDSIRAEGLDSMSEEMLSAVPDHRWILAASKDAVVGAGAAEARMRLGVDAEILFAASKFAR